MGLLLSTSTISTLSTICTEVLLQKEGFDVNNETRDEKQAQDTSTFIELEDVPEGNEEETLSPTGRERELNHGDKNIIYFEPRFGLYEIWNKEQTLFFKQPSSCCWIINRRTFIIKHSAVIVFISHDGITQHLLPPTPR